MFHILPRYYSYHLFLIFISVTIFTTGCGGGSSGSGVPTNNQSQSNLQQDISDILNGVDPTVDNVSIPALDIRVAPTPMPAAPSGVRELFFISTSAKIPIYGLKSRVNLSMNGSDTNFDDFILAYTLEVTASSVAQRIILESRTINNVSSGGVSNTISKEYVYDRNAVLVEVSYPNNGVVGTVSNYQAIPGSIQRGEIGKLYDVSYSDGTTESVYWRLDYDTDFYLRATLVIFSIIYDGSGNVVNTEETRNLIGNVLNNSIALTFIERQLDGYQRTFSVSLL